MAPGTTLVDANGSAAAPLFRSQEASEWGEAWVKAGEPT